jgi:hypothetical protein
MIIDEKKQFLAWLGEIKFLLPPKMSLYEARLLWLRKIKEEQELADNENK